MHRHHLVISVIMTIFILLATLTPTHARDVVVENCDFASLQSAVTTANDGGGIITFDCTGIILFTEQLFITDEVFIVGGGDIIFDGGSATRFFTLTENKSLTLDGLTLQNGAASYGGAIATDRYGDLIIRNSAFLNNTIRDFDAYPSRTSGGAISNDSSSIIISNSTFSGNSDGAISNGGWITITDSTFSDNPNGAIVNDNLWSSVRVSYSTFSNNSAENGGAIAYGDISVTNSTFIGNSATDGGGAISTYGWARISDSTFTDNSATYGGVIAVGSRLSNGGALTITNTVFMGNSASENGGAIYHSGDKIILTGNTFADNSALIGQSAIFSDGLIISQDTHYENNTCGGYGVFSDEGGNTAENAIGCPPDVVPMGTTVTDCANFRGVGTISQAVITANITSQPITFTCSGTILFTSSLFISGDVTIIGGDDIIFDGGGGENGFFTVGEMVKEFPLPREVLTPSSLVIDGVTLQNAGNGAIHNANYGTLTISNSTFSHNSAKLGGAIGNFGVLVISNTTFSDNSAVEDGGAIHSYNTIIITTSTFTNNSAENGGAIISHGRMTIQDTYFEDNTCGGTGILTDNGGNTAQNADGCPSDIIASTVVSDCDNFMGAGTLSEAVSVANVTGEPITFTCSGTIEFTERLYIAGTVTINGGGNIILDSGENGLFFGVWDDNSSLILNDLTLQSGKALGNYDKMIDVSSGTLVIHNSTLIDSPTRTGYGIIHNYSGEITISNSTFIGDAVGGIMIINIGTLAISDSTFSASSISNRGTLTITNSAFSNNSGEYGGAINNDNDGTLTITNTTFSHNSASLGGGAIFNNVDATLIVTDSTFTGNSTSRGGGAITSGGTLVITNSTFLSNSAKSCGAIAGGGTITNSTFRSNSTTENGGAICNGNRLTITNSTFTGNSGHWGGAIFNGQLHATQEPIMSHMTITNSTLSDNMATEGDAIFNASDSTLLSQDTHYENNDCGGSGMFTDNGGNTADNADGCPDGSSE
ncbi:MAG: hypothetical protein SFZ02_06190 [bacterium]|nr:hypothetical protein [bacterium]